MRVVPLQTARDGDGKLRFLPIVIPAYKFIVAMRKAEGKKRYLRRYARRSVK